LRCPCSRLAGHEPAQPLRRKPNHVLHRLLAHYRRHVSHLHLF
jgi:hypothetical protein